MLHHTYDSFGLLMHSAPLFGVTALLFFLFGIGLAITTERMNTYVHLYEAVLCDECASEMEDN